MTRLRRIVDGAEAPTVRTAIDPISDHTYTTAGAMCNSAQPTTICSATIDVDGFAAYFQRALGSCSVEHYPTDGRRRRAYSGVEMPQVSGRNVRGRLKASGASE